MNAFKPSPFFLLAAGACFSVSILSARPARAAESDEARELGTVAVSEPRQTAPAVPDLPAPVGAVSGEELDERRLYQLQDLPQVLPNLTVNFIQPRQTIVSLRGVGSGVTNEGLEGSTGIYLDNVYLGRPGMAAFDLLDLEQVTVLRGPQGTLFGRNTTAGVIAIATRPPVFTPEGSIEVSVGERGYRQFKASYSAPVDDVSALRLSAYDTHDDGWLRNLQDGRRLDGIDRRGLRGQWLLRPDGDFSLRLIVEHHEEDSTTGTLVPYRYGPYNSAYLPATTGTATTFARWVAANGARNVITDPDRYEVSIDGAQNVRVRQDAISAQADWRLGEYRLTSVTAWRDWHYDPINDVDGTSLRALDGGFDTRENQFSQELRLSSPKGGAFDYTAGAWYYRQRTGNDTRYVTGPAATLVGSYPTNTVLTGRGRVETESLALFGQGTWHLTPRLDLTAGLRAGEERKKGRVVQDDVPNLPLVLTASPLFRRWDSGTLRRDDGSLDGMFSAGYRLAPGAQVYAAYSRGEKSGGFNANSLLSIGSVLGNGAITLRPEKADNLEFGFKGEWLERRLQADANLFLTKVRDYQATTNLLYLNNYLNLITNVGDFTSRGLEFSLRAQPEAGLTLTLGGARTLARFDSGTAPTPFEVFNDVGNPVSPLQGYGKGLRSIAGNQVNDAPRWTVNAGFQYRRPLASGVEQYFNGNYAWRSESYGDVNNSIYSRIPGYGLVNLGTGWRIAQGGGRWDLSLWVRNLFDKRYYLGLTSMPGNFYTASAGQPRTLGTSLRYEF